MSAQTLSLIFWIVGPVLQTAICVFLWRKNLRQRYPLFFAYNAFHVVTSIALFAVAKSGDAAVYFLAYWSINALRVGLGFGVIYELFRTALKPYHALRDLGTMIFLWAGAVMLLVASMMAMSGAAEPAARERGAGGSGSRIQLGGPAHRYARSVHFHGGEDGRARAAQRDDD